MERIISMIMIGQVDFLPKNCFPESGGDLYR